MSKPAFSRRVLDGAEKAMESGAAIAGRRTVATVARFWTGATVSIDWRNAGERTSDDPAIQAMVVSLGNGSQNRLKDFCPRFWDGRGLFVGQTALAHVRNAHPSGQDAVAYWSADVVDDQERPAGILRVGELPDGWDVENTVRGQASPGLIVRRGRGNARFGIGVTAIEDEQIAFYPASDLTVSAAGQVAILRLTYPGFAVV